jgi:Fe-S-cluster containining protein
MDGQDFYNVCVECDYTCCRNTKPPITNKRKKLIEDFIKRHGLNLDDPFIHTEYIFIKEDLEGYCTVYNKKKRKCLIHSVKPEICVAWPVTFDINQEEGKIEFYLKRETRCSLAGILLKRKGMLTHHLTQAKKEILTFVRELSAKELNAILKIEEPEPFKICSLKIVDARANQ